MKVHPPRSRPRLVLLAALTSAIVPLHAQTDDAEWFKSNVQPVLRANCLACHSDKNTSSGLSLESREALMHGGNRGPANAILLDAVQQTGDLKMPPGRKLKHEQIAVIQEWAKRGYPMSAVAASITKRRGADHWAFQPPRRAALPMVQNAAWVRSPIDNFILAKLEANKLSPSTEASRDTLLRRVSLDLTGLPPTPAEREAFLNDKRPDAYERLVDRLLASPHYGERWGRHWLDLARYADTDGYTIDAARDIWKYRDWVIDATNKDMPFDQFVIEQIAGDLLPNPTDSQLIATGFHRNTPSNFEGGIDFEQYRVEAVADRVATTGAVFLGLTMGCARCHDHKFDPISQREFYQMFAFFNNVDEVDREAERKYFNKPFLELGTPEQKAAYAQWNEELIRKEAEERKYLESISGDADKDPMAQKFRTELAAFRKKKPALTRTLIMKDLPEPRPAYIHLGGDFTRKGQPVTPGTPAILPPLPTASSGTPNRLQLAQWLVGRDNPLTARVTVNRTWQKYFGHGFVDTENDFGTQGDKPTHPELLDWLALEFMERGWSQKQLHRLIVTSATYRQASEATPALMQADPDNRLLARQSRLRLDAEIVRDASLVAAGLLSPTVGGPSVYPPIPAGATNVTQVKRVWPTSTGTDRYRRGLYTFFQRSAPHPSLVVFDAPDASTTCTRRVRSNTPLQALTMLNDEASLEFATAFSKRLLTEANSTDDKKINQAFLLTLGRAPRAAETTRLVRFLAAQRDAKPNDEPATWLAFSRVMLNLDAFMTRD